MEPKCSTTVGEVPSGERGHRSLIEELSISFGPEELASCLVGRAEKAAAVIESKKSQADAETAQEAAAAAKLVDLASYLRTLLELNQDGRCGVLAQAARIVRLLLEGGSWSASLRHSLHGMVELVTLRSVAHRAASELWMQIAESPSVPQEKIETAGFALAVGSLATELEAALCEHGEKAAESLERLQSLKHTAQLQLRWLRQADRRGKKAQNSEAISPTSESEGELSEDILSDDVSAPSVASGDRASDLEDFIDWSPEHRFGLLRREGSPPREPASSSLTREGMSLSESTRNGLAPQVQEFYNSKLVPDWEARVQSLLLKRPAPPLPKLATEKVENAQEPPSKKTRHATPAPSGLRATVS